MAQQADPAKTYEAAQMKFVERRYGEALKDFQQLLASTDSPNARLYVARCLRELGRHVDAWREMQRTVAHATRRAVKEPSYEQTRATAEAEGREIAGQIGRVRFKPAEPIAQLVVTLNGIDVEDPGEVAAMNPGEITVRATAPGRTPFETTLQITAGEQQTVVLTLPKAGEVAAPGSAKQAAPNANGAPDRTWAYVAGGVGIAGLATFTIAGLSANAKYESLKSDCGGSCTNDQLDSGKRLDLIANIGLGVGVVGIAAGTALWFLATPAKTENVSVAAGPRGAWMSYQRNF